MTTATNIIDLRRMLVERFPEAHRRRTTEPGRRSTGVPMLDHLLGGGLAKGELSELVGEGPGSGSAQVIHAILEQASREGGFMALVDGADSFDVDASAPAALSRLLWVRCRSTDEAMKAADLLVRDRNFPLVILDLKLNAVSSLRRLNPSVWHRLSRIAEHNGTALLVVTPFAMVGGVTVRVEARTGLGLEALRETPVALRMRLRFERLRSAGAVESGAAAVGA